ncbi:MAG: 2Fe-2S iron-sulfur cluster-binding protein [Porticoccaceae bacterium]
MAGKPYIDSLIHIKRLLMAAYCVNFTAGDNHYQVQANGQHRLLDDLASSGLPLRKPCRNGVCGLCRCKLVAGEITYQWRLPHGLWQKDIEQGYILPCIAYALSDLTLAAVSLEQG